MQLSDFDFELPNDRIALRPADPRDSARLLVLQPDEPFQDRAVCDLPDLLQPGDAVVFNDTKVIPARLDGVRLREESRIRVEATLHKRLGPSRWTAFMKPGKRLQPGDRIHFGSTADTASGLYATLTEKGEGGEVNLDFDLAGADLDHAIGAHGQMPLPPYIAQRRGEDARDFADYQTVYARNDGSVAAPTAGLHVTTDLIERLRLRGVSIHHVTLHVGGGTFLPVKTENLAEHRMHAEWGEVTSETAAALNAVHAAGGRIVCVGTTSLRLIESAADEDGRIQPFRAETAIFITPGYRFRAVDVLMTNFHLPKSTLFMLVSAFAGPALMKAAYAHAIETGYRFYSYGDASLLFRAA
jgi:S-adenosylmethionine:tRNA ribosyltransferase-isomerase